MTNSNAANETSPACEELQIQNTNEQNAPQPSSAIGDSLGDPVKSKQAQTRTVWLAVGALVLILGVTGAIWFFGRALPSHSDPALSQTESIPSAQVADMRPNVPEQTPLETHDHFTWEAKFRELDALRQRLMTKKEELLRLQQNYQYGVLELEEEAARLIKSAGIDSLSQGLKNRRLELALQSIQRRQAYRNRLDKPIHWLDFGSEELLYLKRRAILDNHMSKIVEQLDINRNMSDIDNAIGKYEPTTERLRVDHPKHLHAPLEPIWKRVAEQAKTISISAEDQRDDEIAAEICAGDLMRLNELTNLTLKAARCLAESGAMDLFMNRLSRISPVAFRKLTEWKGEWLCLNGLEQLPPKSARHLFRWAGQRVSLNLLREFPAEAAADLVGWQGRQLELMGLQRTTGIESLSRWETSGGRLYVPERIRKQIEEARHR